MSRNLVTFMDDFFDDFYPLQTMYSKTATQPSLNIHEYDDKYEITLRAPGVDPEDVQVELKGSVLTISYDHKDNESSKDGKVLRREYHQHYSFKRNMTMPNDIQSADIKAAYNKGIFTVTVLKKPESHPQKIKVEY